MLSPLHDTYLQLITGRQRQIGFCFVLKLHSRCALCIVTVKANQRQSTVADLYRSATVDWRWFVIGNERGTRNLQFQCKTKPI